MSDVTKFKDIHKGQRGWIVCTGPGLNLIDCSKFDNEILIGLNRAYLKEDLRFNYMVAINKYVFEHYGKDIANYPCKAKFGTGLVGLGPDCYSLRWGGKKFTFTGDITKPLWQGHTVTYSAMQIAYYMGFSEVYVIGMDHYFDYSNFAGPKSDDSHNVRYSKGNDINHFTKDYFAKGHSHATAEPRITEKAFKVARGFYESQGRKLVNASVVTALDEKFLPRVDYLEVLDEKNSRSDNNI